MARVWISPKPWSWTLPSKASKAAAEGDQSANANAPSPETAASARASLGPAHPRLPRVMNPPQLLACRAKARPARPPGDPDAVLLRPQHRRGGEARRRTASGLSAGALAPRTDDTRVLGPQ